MKGAPCSVDMNYKIYADNAATSQLDAQAFDKMKPFLLEVYGNASQPYSFSRTPRKMIKEARNIIAECINAEPEEIFFTSCGTESDNWAIKNCARGGTISKQIITSQIEHHAVLNSCIDIENCGYKVVYLPVNREGIIDIRVLEEALTAPTSLVSIMFANNEIGTIEPIKELCKVAHKKGALFHTDAVQSVGHMCIDVKDLGVDLLSASAHKFNGPKGIGFLYIKKGLEVKPFINGGAQENFMRAGTENVAGIVAMAEALKNNCKRLDDNIRYINYLSNKLLNELENLDIKYKLNGSKNRIPGNLSLSFQDQDGELLLHRLDLMGISVSTGSACDSVNTQISHVLKAIQLSEDFAHGTIRISLGKYNTEEEVVIIAHSIKKILDKTNR